MKRLFKSSALPTCFGLLLYAGALPAVNAQTIPVAANTRFEGSIVGPFSTAKRYAGATFIEAAGGDPANAEAGWLQIEQAGVLWGPAGSAKQLRIVLPEGIKIIDSATGTPMLDASGRVAAGNEINRGIDLLTATNGIPYPGSVAAITRENNREVFTLEYIAAGTPGEAFRLRPYLASDQPGVAGVLVEDIDLGLAPMAAIPIVGFYDTSAIVTASAPPEVLSGVPSQTAADVKVEFTVTIPAPASGRLSGALELDQGTWAGVPGCSMIYLDQPYDCDEVVTRTIDPADPRRMVFAVVYPPIPVGREVSFVGLNIDTTTVAPDTAINATATSTGPGAIAGFVTQTVPIARTASSSGKGVVVNYKDVPPSGYATLFVDRRNETLGDAVILTETAPASLIAKGTLTYALSTGAFAPGANVVSSPAPSANPIAPTCTPAATAGQSQIKCVVGSPASGTAASLVLSLSPSTGQLDMLDAETGDLEVTLGGTAWTAWTGNTVKVAEIIEATNSLAYGNVAVVHVPSETAVTATLPDILIRENVAGALQKGAIVLGVDDGLKVAVSADTRVTVLRRDGSEVSGAAVSITPTVWMEPGAIITTASERGVDVNWSALPPENGPYIIIVSGLQVQSQLADAAAGRQATPVKDYNLTVAGSLLAADIAARLQSDQNAKPYKQSFRVAKVVDSATAWLDVIGSVDLQTIFGNILPATSDLGKTGSYFMMLQMPPRFTGDWSLWTLGPAGWTPAVPSADVSRFCPTMTSYQSGTLADVIRLRLIYPFADMTAFEGVMVWMGYGVGSAQADPLAACLDMFANDTYWYVYTVH